MNPSHATRRIVLVVSGALLAFGCNLVVGSYDFRDDPLTSSEPDGSGGQDASGRDAQPDVIDCNVDLSNQCYPCEPSTNEQLLNACTDGTCIPFDRSRITARLLPDGALPPIPDGGVPEGGPR
ncbi:hypothetical protein AKJ09_00941 [Labilithrix luteola]|uniref:Uncharacterized protein n=1 Tax=Labilithrix luteola TaxID=1391654 RepID=A0A0K1PL87_9BACT|nr:hypothetical protein [Labilithrix luteola]AKU94277.1 hypothetical protein AKJ09_00941 [Labilithrix luteola]